LSWRCATVIRKTSVSPFSKHCCRKISKFEIMGPVYVQTLVRKAALAMLLMVEAIFFSKTRFDTSMRDLFVSSTSFICSSVVAVSCWDLQQQPLPPSSLGVLGSPRLLFESFISCRNPRHFRSCGVDIFAGWQRELMPRRSMLGTSLSIAEQICSMTDGVSLRLSGMNTACFVPGKPPSVNLAYLKSVYFELACVDSV